MVFLVADERPWCATILGLLRNELGRPPVTEGGLHFLWVTDFPMFDDELGPDGRPQAMHHPFTMPNPDDLEAGLIESDPTAVRSVAYDLVCNGWELGSGSVRIHRTDVQQRVFDALGIDEDEAEEKFGFLLDAFEYGPPPHAGFAFGTDRLVALMAGEENIREVIAFPKTQKGADPLTEAPDELEPRILDELGLRVLPRRSSPSRRSGPRGTCSPRVPRPRRVSGCARGRRGTGRAPDRPPPARGPGCAGRRRAGRPERGAHRDPARRGAGSWTTSAACRRAPAPPRWGRSPRRTAAHGGCGRARPRVARGCGRRRRRPPTPRRRRPPDSRTRLPESTLRRSFAVRSCAAAATTSSSRRSCTSSSWALRKRSIRPVAFAGDSGTDPHRQGVGGAEDAAIDADGPGPPASCSARARRTEAGEMPISSAAAANALRSMPAESSSGPASSSPARRMTSLAVSGSSRPGRVRSSMVTSVQHARRPESRSGRSPVAVSGRRPTRTVWEGRLVSGG